MESVIAKYWANCLTKHGIITSDAYDLYKYGLELIISFVISTGMILIFGIALKQFPATIIFLALFISIRQYTGGYHASTYFKCKLCTLFTYAAVITASTYIEVPVYVMAPMLFLGLILVARASPIESPHKPLDHRQRTRNRLIASSCYATVSLICLGISAYAMHYAIVIFFSLMAIISLMIIEIFERRIRHEKGI